MERDVMKKATQVHGSKEAVARLLRMNAEFAPAAEGDDAVPFVSEERKREHAAKTGAICIALLYS
jgi:hypothetical protein